jgi:hypothetical protein
MCKLHLFLTQVQAGSSGLASGLGVSRSDAEVTRNMARRSGAVVGAALSEGGS